MQNAADMLKALYPVCDRIDCTQFGAARRDPSLTMRSVLRMDVICFCMYLSASDGRVTPHEAAFLSDLFGEQMTPVQIVSIIRERHIYSETFEQQVPFSMQCFVNMDNAALAAGKKPDPPVCEMLLSFFRAAGEAFLLCDGSDQGDERADLSLYMEMLKRYVRHELNF